jgi:hypothetical protein
MAKFSQNFFFKHLELTLVVCFCCVGARFSLFVISCLAISITLCTFCFVSKYLTSSGQFFVFFFLANFHNMPKIFRMIL